MRAPCERRELHAGIVTPAIRSPADPVNSETSRTPLAGTTKAGPRTGRRSEAIHGGDGHRRRGRRVVFTVGATEGRARPARRSRGLPGTFRYRDLRHYLASLLIASGLDAKVVQTRPRHASAMTTPNTYDHMWPWANESSRAAVAVLLAARKDSSRTQRNSPTTALCGPVARKPQMS